MDTPNLPPENLEINTSLDTLVEEVKIPTADAIDVPALTNKEFMQPMPGTGTAGAFVPPPPPPAPQAYVPVPDAPPMFKQEEPVPNSGTPGAPPEEEKKPSYTAEYKEKMLRFYLEMEDNGLAWLACQITKTKDPSAFKYTDSEREMILLALEPYKDFIIEKLPAWLPLMVVYIGAKVRCGMRIYKTIQENKEAAAILAKSDTKETIKTAAAKPAVRTNFKIYASDGYYLNDRDGNYLKRTSEEKEKPSMRDLQAIVDANPLKVVLKALDITEADLQAHGIAID